MNLPHTGVSRVASDVCARRLAGEHPKGEALIEVGKRLQSSRAGGPAGRWAGALLLRSRPPAELSKLFWT